MYNTIGRNVRLSIFGESHGKGIGCIIEGLPAGEEINMAKIAADLKRRAPGQDLTATPRVEADDVKFLSGILSERTTGAPVCAVIENTNTKSGDYSNIVAVPRPSHADFPAYIKYKGYNDIRGGGAFSGRLTAPLVVAGAICKQILSRRGVEIAGHVLRIGQVCDENFDTLEINALLMEKLQLSYFPTINVDVKEEMREVILKARDDIDSIGGIIECAATGLPVGAGAPMFYGVENVLSQLIFGVPAVKGIEFGDGFAFGQAKASEVNDPYTMDGERIITTSNHNGGILGGMTTGMPLILRAVIKPTCSIARTQASVDLERKADTTITIAGRHDPCIVPRAVPAIEACVAFGLLDLLIETE